MRHDIAFLSVFALTGTVIVGSVSWNLHRAHRVQQWIPVPAQILTTDLELYAQTEDHDHYRVNTQYTYSFDGRRFASSRVHVNRQVGIDSGEEAQRELFELLRAHQSSGDDFTCYVNPADPSQSVLIREVVYIQLFGWLILGILFGGVGWASIAALVIAGRAPDSPRRNAPSLSRPAGRPASSLPSRARPSGSSRPAAPAATLGGRTASVAMLLGANGFVLALALHQGWPLDSLVPIYWVQSLLIWLSNEARLVLFPRERVSDALRVNVSGRQIEDPGHVKLLGVMASGVLFGSFHLIHLFFVVAVFDAHWVLDRGFWIPVGAFAASQLWNVARAVAADRAPGSTTRLSYGPVFARIVVIHLVLLLGAHLTESTAGLVLFLLLKTGADVALYLREASASSLERPRDRLQPRFAR